LSPGYVLKLVWLCDYPVFFENLSAYNSDKIFLSSVTFVSKAMFVNNKNYE